MDARKRAYGGNPGPRAGSLLSRDERIEILLMHGRRSRGSDGSARLERPHFVSAPDEAATEAAADPEQRQEDVPQDKGGARSKAQMPCRVARERGFGAIPRGRDRKTAAQRQPQRRNDVRGCDERTEAAGQNLQRVILPERGLPQLRPAQLTRPYFASGAVAEGLLER